MGNQSSSSFKIPIQTDRSFELSNQNNKEATFSQRIGHKIITVKNNDELKILKKNFDFRLRHKQFLAHLYGFQLGDNQSQSSQQKIPCKSLFSSTKVTLHYEKIAFKFSNLYNVSIHDGSKLLSHCLKGFSLLLENYGYFTPEPCHIFKQGQSWVVWISDNIFSIKNQIEDKTKDNSRQRCRFWQKIIHLFDVLRDEQNPQFSYSSYIYGVNQPFSNLQLLEILQKLHQITQVRNKRKNSGELLRKRSDFSNQTIKKQERNIDLSFEQNRNDATLSKFNSKNIQMNKKMTKQKQSLKLSAKNSKNSSNQNFIKTEKHQIVRAKEEQSHQKQNFVNLQRVSSKPSKQTNCNEVLNSNQHQPNKHRRNTSQISSITNCTGHGNEILPIRVFENLHEADKNFTKKSKSKSATVDCSVVTNFQPVMDSKVQPRKITQNSQIDSQNSDEYDQTHQLKQNSFSSSDEKDQAILFGPSQFIDEDESIKATSISGNNKYQKQSMQNLQEYLNLNLKNQHRRSLTDQIVLEGQPKKIKLCLSQEFDSEFFSSCSKREIPSSKFFINGLGSGKEIKKQMNSEINISIGNSQMRNSQKHIKKVTITDENNQVRIIKDSILENSDMQDSCIGPKQASIAKLAIFKSEGGLKSLLGTKMYTLKSIKQIDVQVPIDEQILYDLNKMFPRHHFSKSTKITN